jgi:hypothetical protein
MPVKRFSGRPPPQELPSLARKWHAAEAKYISGLWQNRAPIEGNEDPMVHELFMVENTLFISASVDPLGPSASRGAVLLSSLHTVHPGV